jgi:hypothetical protein
VARLPFSAVGAKRDLRIDWLRGLAMTCVIINHTRRSSPLSWFSYERFWVVTAAEVFVVLSGVVLGMVYGRRLARDGWPAVVRGLGRRAVLLYVAFVAVTTSVFALGALGFDIRSVIDVNRHSFAALLERPALAGATWQDVLLMRAGIWPFEIIGLYVCLVPAAIPCFLLLRAAGWRAMLAASWALYLWYRVDPHALTPAGFETAFPVLAWQLLFVHGIAIGYHRDAIAEFAARLPRFVLPAAAVAAAAFALFAFCNPWTGAPDWLRVRLVSPEQFATVYGRYFMPADLRAGRLLNLMIGLPVGYVLLTRFSSAARRLEPVFVILGQRSLGAFVLHVYGLLLLAQLRLPNGIWINALVQAALVLAIAAVLNVRQLRRFGRQPVPSRPEQLAA